MQHAQLHDSQLAQRTSLLVREGALSLFHLVPKLPHGLGAARSPQVGGHFLLIEPLARRRLCPNDNGLDL